MSDRKGRLDLSLTNPRGLTFVIMLLYWPEVAEPYMASKLSAREVEVLRLIAKGVNKREIDEHIVISKGCSRYGS